MQNGLPGADLIEAGVIDLREGRETVARSEEHTSELQSQSNLVCRLLLEKKKTRNSTAKKRRRPGPPLEPYRPHAPLRGPRTSPPGHSLSLVTGEEQDITIACRLEDDMMR